MGMVNLGRILDAAALLKSNPPPGFFVGNAGGIFSLWHGGGMGGNSATAYVYRSADGLRGDALPAVILTPELDGLVKAVLDGFGEPQTVPTGRVGEWEPKTTKNPAGSVLFGESQTVPTTARAVRVESLAARMSHVLRLLCDNRGMLVPNRVWEDGARLVREYDEHMKKLPADTAEAGAMFGGSIGGNYAAAFAANARHEQAVRGTATQPEVGARKAPPDVPFSEYSRVVDLYNAARAELTTACEKMQTLAVRNEDLRDRNEYLRERNNALTVERDNARGEYDEYREIRKAEDRERATLEKAGLKVNIQMDEDAAFNAMRERLTKSAELGNVRDRLREEFDKIKEEVSKVGPCGGKPEPAGGLVAELARRSKERGEAVERLERERDELRKSVIEWQNAAGEIKRDREAARGKVADLARENDVLAGRVKTAEKDAARLRESVEKIAGERERVSREYAEYRRRVPVEPNHTGYDPTREQLAEVIRERAKLEDEIRAVVRGVPVGYQIEVREGGGPENLAATLAATVGNVVGAIKGADGRVRAAQDKHADAVAKLRHEHETRLQEVTSAARTNEANVRDDCREKVDTLTKAIGRVRGNLERLTAANDPSGYGRAALSVLNAATNAESAGIVSGKKPPIIAADSADPAAAVARLQTRNDTQAAIVAGMVDGIGLALAKLRDDPKPSRHVSETMDILRGACVGVAFDGTRKADPGEAARADRLAEVVRMMDGGIEMALSHLRNVAPDHAGDVRAAIAHLTEAATVRPTAPKTAATVERLQARNDNQARMLVLRDGIIAHALAQLASQPANVAEAVRLLRSVYDAHPAEGIPAHPAPPSSLPRGTHLNVLVYLGGDGKVDCVVLEEVTMPAGTVAGRHVLRMTAMPSVPLKGEPHVTARLAECTYPAKPPRQKEAEAAKPADETVGSLWEEVELLRTAVYDAGYSIVYTDGLPRLTKIDADDVKGDGEPADPTDDGDDDGDSYLDDDGTPLEDREPTDAERIAALTDSVRNITAANQTLHTRVNGLRVLLNFANLRARVLHRGLACSVATNPQTVAIRTMCIDNAAGLQLRTDAALVLARDKGEGRATEEARLVAVRVARAAVALLDGSDESVREYDYKLPDGFDGRI